MQDRLKMDGIIECFMCQSSILLLFIPLLNAYTLLPSALLAIQDYKDANETENDNSK